MIDIFTKLKNYLARPGHLFKTSNYNLRKIYYYISIFFHPRTFFFRKIYKKKNFLINKEKGFKKIENFHQLNFSNIELENLKKNIKNNETEPIYFLMKDEDFDTESDIFKFVTSDKVINIVSDYLGFIPLLTTVSIWYSPNIKNIENSSQFFHLDHEDINQVKCFFLIDNIDMQMGPTQFIDAKKSEELMKKIDYRITKKTKRISDNNIFQYLKNEDVNFCNGKKDTIFFLDTSKCFHAGSRKSEKSRTVLFFQYLSPFSNHFDWIWQRSGILNKPKWKNSQLTDLQKKVLGIKI
tara:strand:+ start:2216 stop:3100 length:885 start_codon:yes stop_codon:yes gene_type:complete